MDYNAILNLLKGKNISALKGILSSDESRAALSKVLNEADGRRALQDAQRGDTTAAKDILEKLVATPEGKVLIGKLLSNLGGNNG